MTDVILNFDRSAAGYEANSAPQAALAAALATWINPADRQGLAIEFGAGTGLFTRHMHPWLGTYTATDAAPGMVKRGQMLAPAAKWEIADAREVQRLGPADWIFACNLLQWLDEPEKVLRGWRKIMPAKGQFAAAVLLPGTFPELERVLPGVAPLPWHDREEWSKFLADAGFEITRAEIWEHREIFPNARAFLRSLHAMGLAPRRMVGAGRLRAALRHYDKEFAVGGRVRATWQAWLVRARAG